MNIEEISQDETIVNLGLILRINLDSIGGLKRYCADNEIRIIYQQTTTDRIRVVKEKDLLALSEQAGP
jgi:hypothetical protein